MTGVQLSRRAALKGLSSGAAGFVLAMHLPGVGRVQAAVSGQPASDAVFVPNAFIRVAQDDTVTVLIKHIEFGQGPYTGLSTLVAEEMDADWSQMRAEGAPADASKYGNAAFGGIQGTGGSTAMASSFEIMRKAGATARAMLVAAAAEEWGVEASEISVVMGVVSHAESGRSARFGELASRASEMDPPEDPPLKDPADFVLIGKQNKRIDSTEKTTGRALFTIDVVRPGMLTVMVARPPRFGGKVASFDAAKALAIDGVVDVKEIPQGVAVYATGYWPAKKGREALEIAWDDSEAETRSSAEIIADYQKALDGADDMREVEVRGAVSGPLKGRTFAAEYVFPYLAHAPMEPLDCVIQRQGDGVRASFGSQIPTVDQGAIAGVLGLSPEKVAIDVLMAGGSFGRRAQPTSHLAAEAADALKAMEGERPLKLVWSREDDLKGGYYRPIYVHRLEGALDDEGNITGWRQKIAGQSILAGSAFEAMVQDGIDPTSIEGARGLPYAIPAFRVELNTRQGGVPVLWWRSVGHTHTGFSTETFMDELLEAAGKDPVEGRLALLGDQPRHAGVLRAAAQLADWGRAPGDGRAFGVALHKSFDTYVAQIAEVSMANEVKPKVHKVWCAVDCGIPVNPDMIRMQMESGIGYGLGAAMYNEITLDDGYVRQKNFDDYWPIRIDDMPAVEVEVVASTEPPTGVGEPGVPPIAPAVANAMARLTGRRVRKLPFVDVPAIVGGQA